MPRSAFPLITVTVALMLLTAVAVSAQATDDPVMHAGELIGDAAAQDFLSVEDVAHYQRIGVIARDGEGAEAAAGTFRVALVNSGRTIPPLDEARQATNAVGVGWGTDSPMNTRDIALIMERLDVQALIAIRTIPTVQDARITTLGAHVALADPGEIGRPWSVDVEVDVPQQQPRQSYWQQHPKLIWGSIIALVVLWLLSVIARRRGK